MKIVTITGLILAIVVALAWIDRTVHPKPLNADVMPLVGVGQVLAEQAAQALNDNGQIVVIYLTSRESQSELEGFENIIGKHDKITIIAKRAFGVTETKMGRLSFEQFADVISQYPNANLIVTFMGITSFTDDQMAELPKPSPKLVVMDWNPSEVQRGMKSGLVVAAVSMRHLSSLPTDHPRTSREWFDRYYTLETAQ